MIEIPYNYSAAVVAQAPGILTQLTLQYLGNLCACCCAGAQKSFTPVASGCLCRGGKQCIQP